MLQAHTFNPEPCRGASLLSVPGTKAANCWYVPFLPFAPTADPVEPERQLGPHRQPRPDVQGAHMCKCSLQALCLPCIPGQLAWACASLLSCKFHGMPLSH